LKISNKEFVLKEKVKTVAGAIAIGPWPLFFAIGAIESNDLTAENLALFWKMLFVFSLLCITNLLPDNGTA
jgi:hypothetical protein